MSASNNSSEVNNNNTNNTTTTNNTNYKSNFLEFKKDAQKLIQTRSALILVVDPGPAEEVSVSPVACPENNNNDSPSSISVEVAKKKQEIRCAEVDRCCKAVCRVLSNGNPASSSPWSEKVSSLPLILVNTSSGVSKFRRATRLYNGRSAFLVISEDFFNGKFYSVALDKVKFVDDLTFPSASSDQNNSNHLINNNISSVPNNNNNHITSNTDAAAPVVVTPSPYSVLTVCEKMLEQRISNFFSNYEAGKSRKTLLGAPRPENDRDDHVGTHSCALVQETYQEQLRNEDCCTLVIYHASSCPACPCALRCTDFIVSFLQQEAAKVCGEHQEENNLQNDSQFQYIAKVSNASYPVRSGVVDFCPCGLKKTEKWPLLVCGALNIEENEIDHSLFPELTVPHFRFFPCGKEKENRRQIIERTVRCPTFLFDKVREHYFSAAAQYSDGLATNEVFAKSVNTIFERAKVAVEKKLSELCPQVAASLENKTREDFVSAGVNPDIVNNDEDAAVASSTTTDAVPQALPTAAAAVASNEIHKHDNNTHQDGACSSSSPLKSTTTNTNSNSEDAAAAAVSSGNNTTSNSHQNGNNNNNGDNMNEGKRVIRPEDIAQKTAEFDSGVRRSREP